MVACEWENVLDTRTSRWSIRYLAWHVYTSLSQGGKAEIQALDSSDWDGVDYRIRISLELIQYHSVLSWSLIMQNSPFQNIEPISWYIRYPLKNKKESVYFQNHFFKLLTQLFIIVLNTHDAHLVLTGTSLGILICWICLSNTILSAIILRILTIVSL